MTRMFDPPRRLAASAVSALGWLILPGAAAEDTVFNRVRHDVGGRLVHTAAWTIAPYRD